jgi:hypothetical protein
MSTQRIHCAGTTEQGKPCRKTRQHNSDFCYWHDPATEEERKTGVRRLPQTEPLLPEPASLQTPEEIQTLLITLANDLATSDRPDTARAQALARVSLVLLRATTLRGLTLQVTHLQDQLTESLREKAEFERQLTHARQDLDRSRRAFTELRDRVRAPCPLP